MTAKTLQYKAPGAKIKWSMDLKSMLEVTREPSGYLASGKIEFQVDPSRCARSQANRTKLQSVWQCQVCEEINESTGQKCQICGSNQKGELIEVEIDVKAELAAGKSKGPWSCEVCEEENDGTRPHCVACGFGRPEEIVAPAKIEKDTWSCSQCTFSNSLSRGAGRSVCQVCGAPHEHKVSIAKQRYRLSFRSGGSTVFFAKLKMTWEAEVAQIESRLEDAVTVGISGLLRRQEERNLATEASLSTAFSDLDTLMRSAGEMVQLATKISEKVAGDLSSKERNTFNDLVESLGIGIDTEETVLSTEFHGVIARNVSNLVQTMISKTGTRVYSLADVYCIYNRARTTGSLIAPADLLKAARQMTPLALPIRLHQFTSKGMLCLVPAQDIDPLQLYALIREIVQDRGAFLTAVDLAEKSRISLFLAGQQLEMAERSGKIVRDGKRKDLPAFYLNIFLK